MCWIPRASCPIRKIECCAIARNAGAVFFPPPWVNDPDMHHGTYVMHVPWCMPGSLTHGFLWNRWRENVPGIPGAWPTCDFTLSGKRPIVVIQFTAAWCLPDFLAGCTSINYSSGGSSDRVPGPSVDIALVHDCLGIKRVSSYRITLRSHDIIFLIIITWQQCPSDRRRLCTNPHLSVELISSWRWFQRDLKYTNSIEHSNILFRFRFYSECPS